MPNTIIWDPATSAFRVEMDPPTTPEGPTMVTNAQINASPVTPEVTNRVYSSYIGPPANGVGGGYTWWEVPPQGSNPPYGNPNWNVPGPAYGAPVTQFYIQPTYLAAGGWKTYNVPPVQTGPNQYTFNDPAGGGSTSIAITMQESGGGL